MHPAMQRRRHRLMIRRTARRRNPRRGLTTFLLASVGVFVLFVGSMAAGTAGGLLAAYQYFATGLPDPLLLDGIELPASTRVYDRSGMILLARFECENREQVHFAGIPDSIVNATVAAEDRTFWTNDGIDYSAVVRAALANLEAGEIVQGASTITQQVIKYAGSIKLAQEVVDAPSVAPSLDLGLDPEATADDPCEQPALTFLETGRQFEDKIQEAILARQVTAAYPGRAGKEKILETYLNLIYYGNRSFGIKAAAANFFGTSNLDELSLSQAAFLAGLPQLPSYYDPYQPAEEPRGPDRAMARRNDVLAAMLRDAYITQAEHDRAVAVTWEEMGPSRVTSVLREPHFSFRVQREAERILASLGVTNPQQAVLTGGYRITSTLDYGLQQVAKAQVTDYVTQLARSNNAHNAALVSVDSATGEIVAYVGSVDYYSREDPRVRGQFDVAGLSVRQPGSAFKPITYSAAFRARQATPATMFVDALTQFGSGVGTGYVPANADLSEHGPLLAMDALRYSLNVPSVMMQYLVGVNETAQFAESMGVASAQYILDQDPGITLTLGSVPVNLTNMTQAYGVFAQQGTRHPATAVIEIRDRDGRIVYSREENGPAATTPMTPAEAYLTHWIIQGNTDPRLNLWWGRSAMLVDANGNRRDAAAKTGTTNDFKDVTAFGYASGSLATGVWMGNSNGDPLTASLFAANGPLLLWREFMDAALNQPWDWNGQAPVVAQTFAQPPGIVTASICKFSGMAATGGCGPTTQIPFLEGTVPPPDNVHVNKTGGGGATPDPSASSDGGTPVSGPCFDIVAAVAQDSRRPAQWAASAKRWADRLVNGELGGKGNPNSLGTLGPEKVWFYISPVPGKGGYGAPICGDIKATPTPQPTPTPDPNATGGPPLGCPPGNPKCTPVPTITAASAASTGAAIDAASLAGLFGASMLLGLVPLLVRAASWSRRRRRLR